jgi:phenylalanyl-tRNA synthetase beta chain
MKVTWNWLAELVELDLPLQRLADRLDMAGLEVESIEERGGDLAGVCVAEVISVRPHPNAPSLTVCEVRTAPASRSSIVCGAPNVKAGARVACALPGARLPGGRTIAAAEIRGVPSAGMLCSESELGLGPDESGLLLLPGDAAVGEPIAAYLQVEDTVIEVSITPNRGDCLSVWGLAREIAALTGQRLRRPRVNVQETGEAAAELIGIRIDDDDLCGRYVGRVITDVKIAASPLWLQYRLRAVGMRPINNVVDATNYVMLERGQPLHAFDYDRLPRQQIVVRRAAATTRFTTLDGQSRQLEADDLLITTGEEVVAIAGVMGGANSEVGDATHRIFLESAWFAPASVRRTAKRLGLRTEASYRFERCVDIEGVPTAADRAAALIAKLAGGKVAGGRVDVYPSARSPAPIALRLKRMDDLLGMTIARADVVAKLKLLGMSVSPATRATITVVPPSYRTDLMREIDVIEEVVRLVGYENVPATLPQCELGGAGLGIDERRHREIKRFLISLGLSEVLPLSFCSQRLNQQFPGLQRERRPVVLLNPMTQDDGEMRLSLCASLVPVVRHNLDQGSGAVALFTLGKVFWRAGGFAEARHLAGAVCTAVPAHGLGERDKSAGFLDVKGVLEALFESLGIDDVRWIALTDAAAFHPGQTARIEVRGSPVGLLGALHPALCDELQVRQPCWLFELDLDQVLQYCPPRITFQELPRFPAVIRDLAIVADDRFASDEIVRCVRNWQAGAAFVEDVHLFDEYVGDPIPAGKKSLAYSIAYRAPDRTLTDAEVNELHQSLIKVLTESLTVQPR